MRGHRERSGSLFSYVSIEERIPASHPLRRIRKLADQALDRLNPTFCALYAAEGRPSVPPEQLLLASLLQAFYGIRSERLLLEQLHYNLLFRWFVGLSPDDPIWHPTTFTKNRERLLNEQVMGRFLEKLMGAPEVKPLLSDEHFSVDGTLLQAWASHASLERIDGQDDPPPPPSGPGEGFGQPKEGKKRAKGDFRGIKLSNKTHRSSVDPDALLARKSNAHPAQPSYRGHVLMDNRHALIVDCKVTQATGTGERDAAKDNGGGSSRCPPENPGCRQELRHQGLCRRDAPHRRDAPRGAEHRPHWRFCHRWSHCPPRGLRQVDPCPPRHREGVWLDQTVGRSASVQAARHRQGECGVWPACDRLQPDPPGQPAQTGDGGGMNSRLPRGVPKRQRSGSPNGVKRLKSGLLGR
jgi:transposase